MVVGQCRRGCLPSRVAGVGADRRGRVRSAERQGVTNVGRQPAGLACPWQAPAPRYSRRGCAAAGLAVAVGESTSGGRAAAQAPISRPRSTRQGRCLHGRSPRSAAKWQFAMRVAPQRLLNPQRQAVDAAPHVLRTTASHTRTPLGTGIIGAATPLSPPKPAGGIDAGIRIDRRRGRCPISSTAVVEGAMQRNSPQPVIRAMAAAVVAKPCHDHLGNPRAVGTAAG